MDNNASIKKIFARKEMYDYYYIISFLFIFSFFIFYIIKPSLSTAFTLKTEYGELSDINRIYDQNVTEIQKIAIFLEKNRDNIDLIEQAIPQMPETKTLIEDIKNSASQNNVTLVNLTLSSLDLKNQSKNNELKSLIIKMDTSGEYANVMNFADKLLLQRRLKNINTFKIMKNLEEVQASGESDLKVNIELIGYYL